MKDKKLNQEKESVYRSTKLEITIPFQWEEKPGTPKREWKPKREPLPLLPPPLPLPLPIKYVASIPFKWEEKPGTPLRCFVKDTKESETLEKKCLPLPPSYFNKYENKIEKEISYDYDYDYDYEYDYEYDCEETRSEEEENFGTPPSHLLANCLVSKEMISSAKPLCHPPKYGYFDKGCTTKRRFASLDDDRLLLGDYQGSGVIRRPSTLGELMMLNKKRTNHKKVIHMRKRIQPKEFAQDEAYGCFNLGANGGIAKLGKDLMRLNLAYTKTW